MQQALKQVEMKTLVEKIWEAHCVKRLDENTEVLYIDRHFIHEVTSPQAFELINQKGVGVFRKERITATADHNVPTIGQDKPIQNELSRKQVNKLEENCTKHDIPYYGLGHEKQGIVHVIGPEQGLTRPGMTIVCGDSHTATHGAFGAIAFGIGTSQVAQVLASQCLIVSRPKVLNIHIDGSLNDKVTPKDVVLYIISKLGTNAGNGYFIEYTGDVFKNMSMEGRMTVCNMSIEMGARGGLITPDETTFKYLKNRCEDLTGDNWDKKLGEWRELKTDDNAQYDKVYSFQASEIPNMITWGTNPGMAMGIDGNIPGNALTDPLKYMGFKAGQQLIGTKVNYVFVGSCTNARIEDFRAVADYVRGKEKAPNVKAYLVPGSRQVLKQIQEEKLDEVLNAAGFDIREPGCSACLAMNEDKIPPGEYCVSTSNRNFEGRQGKNARTILASPVLAAAVAVHGEIVKI